MQSEVNLPEVWLRMRNEFGENYPREGSRCLFHLYSRASFRYEKDADRTRHAKRTTNGRFMFDIRAYGYRYGLRVYLPEYCCSVSVNDVQAWLHAAGPDYYNGYDRDGEESFLKN